MSAAIAEQKYTMHAQMLLSRVSGFPSIHNLENNVKENISS
jgi:hypothetical protein